MPVGRDVIDRDDFRSWLVLKGLDVAGELFKWWMAQADTEEASAVDGFAKYRGDTEADFFEAIRTDAQERGWLADGEFTVAALARWCNKTIEGFGGDDFKSIEDLTEYMEMEFRMAGEQHARHTSAGGMDDGAEEGDVDVERRTLAEASAGGSGWQVNFGWHSIAEEPSGMRDVGRFEKAVSYTHLPLPTKA